MDFTIVRSFLSICKMFLLVSVFSLTISNTVGFPVVNSTTQAIMYLSQFGYMDPSLRNPNSGAIISEDSWSRSLMDFQRFAGIPETGDLDAQTLELMSIPRCGVKDKVGFGNQARRKRYALQGSRWKVRALTYRISKYPSRLDRKEVDDEVAKAFDVWAQHTELTFTAVTSGRVHIDIRFEKGEHNDGDPFDGPGGTLAHAYFPIYGGDAHFDDAEMWTIKSSRGTNLFQVAAHEFGHSLGLSHSDVKKALMAPFYRGYDSDFNLHQDDVEGIQGLYGKKKSSSTPSKKPVTPGPETGEDGELCTDATVDAAFMTDDGITYTFKGEHYWRLTDDGIAQGYPRLISQDWDGLPSKIDAAFTYKNGRTYFFKGSQYWRYSKNRMDDGYPKEISEGFQGIPNNVDAAFVWSGNGKIYFLKDSKFWRFDPTQKPPVKSTYPKPISNWDGIPASGIDAALQYSNGYTYFFKDGMYWRFNDRTFSVDDADPPFPRPAGYWWFGCRSASSGGRSGNLKDTVATSEIKDEMEHGNDNDVDNLEFDAGQHQGMSDIEEVPQSHVPLSKSPASASDRTSASTLATTLLALAVLFRQKVL